MSGAGAGSDGDDRGWRRISRLVDEAMQRPREERLAFLRARCGDDAALRAAAEPLLRATEVAAGSHGEHDATADAPPPARTPLLPLDAGTRVGPYVVRRHVGSGSFGDVYAAESTDASRQRVALKVIKAGMHSAEVLARFEQEQRALGLMSHSGIARVISTGATDDGRPYFAMEHVAGVHVTTHCDSQQLGLEERLRIVIMICEAVQHAHQKGIIHRDLKPANILVAYEGDRTVVKIIDFGVAKALTQPLTDRLVYTDLEQAVGTPAYMSPEQAEGGLQDVDTRSDVYSLGVLLYELLAGLLPLELAACSREELRRRIREEEPRKPSSRFAALAKEDAARAAAIAEARGMAPRQLVKRLSGDLDWIVMRCLEKDRARRYAGVDRLADDLRRHLAFEPVEAGKPSSLVKARKFVRRHRAAVGSAAIVGTVLLGALVAITTERVKSAQLRRQDERARAKELLERGRLLLHASAEAARPDDDAASMTAFAPGTAFEECRETLRRAVELDPDLVEARLLFVESWLLDGDRGRARREAAIVAAQFPGSARARALLAALDGNLSDVRGLAGDDVHPAQLMYYAAVATPDDHAAIALLELSRQMDPWSLESLLLLSVKHRARGDHSAMLDDTSLLVKVQPNLALTWALRADALRGLHRYEAAVQAQSKAIELGGGSWRAHYDRALAALKLGRYPDVLADLERARRLSPGNPRISALRAEALLMSGRHREAIAAYDEAIRLGDRSPWILQGRGSAWNELGETERALTDFDAALGTTVEISARFRARVLNSRGIALLDASRADEAISSLVASCKLAPAEPWAHEVLGRAYLRASRWSEAMASYDEALRLAPGSRCEYERAVAAWFGGDRDSARPVLTRWASVPGYHWMHLWVWDLEASRGNRSGADSALAAAEGTEPSSDEAFAAVIGVLRGHVRESEVDWSRFEPAQRLYSSYILGALAAAEGRREDALVWYRTALELHLSDELETDIVAHHLKLLTAA